MKTVDEMYEQGFTKWDYSFGADADTFSTPEDNYALYLLRSSKEALKKSFGKKNVAAIRAKAREQLTGNANTNVRICGNEIYF
jgi:hypothetical protein|nr:MAG TPA: hypothetical protein [Caudoviricetes sp.]